MHRRLWWLLVPAFAALVFVACSDSEGAACGTDDDCQTNQVCEDGACKTISQVRCDDDFDCRGGEQCSMGVCSALPREDMGNNVNNENSVNNTNNVTIDMGGDVPQDNVNPEVESVTPADGTEDVAVDATIQVVFNEDMDFLTVNFQSLQLKSPAGDVDAAVDYDEATRTATITPNNPLLAGTGYRVVPTAFLKDEAGNTLRIDPSPDTQFYTALAEPAHHTAIAEKYAPVIYQSIEDDGPGAVNRDIPTTVNFDGNWKARDNKAAARLGVTRTDSHVYYSVVESKTSYFITYALYYPIRRDKSANELYEHDFTGVQFVVDKANGTFKLAEGVKVDAGNDTVIAYKPDSSDVTGTGAPQTLENFSDSNFDGDRYPLFITSGTHEACHWYKEGPTLPAVCRHNAEEFSDGGMGVIMRPGAAQKYVDAVDSDNDTIKEMTYALVPLSTTLWSRRSFVDNDGLWELLSIYSPIDMRPSLYPVTMDPVVWPNRLVSDDETSFGKPPFAWLKLSGQTNQGQWLFDPAYLLTVRYNFGTMFSNEYCYNYFLGIDQIDAADVPECATPSM